jgi:Protein of unknown function (DUF1194)
MRWAGVALARRCRTASTTLGPPTRLDDRVSSGRKGSGVRFKAAVYFGMTRRLATLLTAAFALCASLLSQPVAHAQQVDVALVLAADVSRSIDQEEFELQRRGYAAAVTSSRFLKAVASLPHGAVALCFVEWAGAGDQAVIANWTVIRDGEGAAEFASVLLTAPRSSMGRTAIGDALDFAVSQLETATIAPERRVIDVSGDGTSNSGRLVTAARDDAVRKGITINGLAIINEKTSGEFGGYLWAHTHPPGGLPSYYQENVIGGPGAFALQIVNFDEFADAMTNKLITEISKW